MICPRCQSVVQPNITKCPSCKLWLLDNVGADTSPKEAVDDEEDKSVPLSSKNRQPPKPRLNVGWLNPLFGGGIVTTSTCMLGGSPGAGKSTLVQQMWRMLLEQYPDRKVVAASAEECREEGEARAIRLGLPQSVMDRIMVVDAMAGNYNLVGAIAKHKPILVTIDSLQKYCGRHAFQAQEQLLADCKQLAVQYGCPVVVISQVNKDDDIAGSNANQHETDANFVLTKDENDIRYFDILKNRNGPTDLVLRMEMTPTGLKPLPDEPEDEDT